MAVFLGSFWAVHMQKVTLVLYKNYSAAQDIPVSDTDALYYKIRLFLSSCDGLNF